MMLEGSTIVPFAVSEQYGKSRRSVFLVKLTDASRSNLDKLLRNVSFKSSSSVDVGDVEIHDNEGDMRLGSTNPTEYRFSLSDMHSELAKGQLQSIFQSGDDDGVKVCGTITQRLKILANDKETFESTKKKALQEIEDAKRQSEILTNVKAKSHNKANSLSFSHRKLQNLGVPSSIQRPLTPVRGLSSKATPGSNAGGSKPGQPAASAPASKYGDVSKKSLRQRVVQHLALRPSKPSDLLARLTKEGLNDEDKLSFEPFLNDVAQPKAQSNGEVELRLSAWQDVRTDWPHYNNKFDKECVKKYVAAKIMDKSLNASQLQTKNDDAIMWKKKDDSGKSRVVPPPPPSQQQQQASAVGVGSSSVSAVGMSPGYMSPLDSIIPDPEQGRRRTHKRSVGGANGGGDVQQPTPAKQSTFDAGKRVNNAVDSSNVEDTRNNGISKSSKGVFINGPTLNGQTATPTNLHQSNNQAPASKHVNSVQQNHINQNSASSADDRSSPTTVFNNNNNEDKSANVVVAAKRQATSDAKKSKVDEQQQVDYLKLYPPIRTNDERRQYKDLFDRDYQRYMDAYNKLHAVAVEFEKLGDRLERLPDKTSREYKSVEREICLKYEKFEQDPDLTRYKTEHEMLRSKLAVLKDRCMEYDKKI